MNSSDNRIFVSDMLILIAHVESLLNIQNQRNRIKIIEKDSDEKMKNIQKQLKQFVQAQSHITQQEQNQQIIHDNKLVDQQSYQYNEKQIKDINVQQSNNLSKSQQRQGKIKNIGNEGKFRINSRFDSKSWPQCVWRHNCYMLQQKVKGKSDYTLRSVIVAQIGPEAALVIVCKSSDIRQVLSNFVYEQVRNAAAKSLEDDSDIIALPPSKLNIVNNQIIEQQHQQQLLLQQQQLQLQQQDNQYQQTDSETNEQKSNIHQSLSSHSFFPMNSPVQSSLYKPQQSILINFPQIQQEKNKNKQQNKPNSQKQSSKQETNKSNISNNQINSSSQFLSSSSFSSQSSFSFQYLSATPLNKLQGPPTTEIFDSDQIHSNSSSEQLTQNQTQNLNQNLNQNQNQNLSSQSSQQTPQNMPQINSAVYQLQNVEFTRNDILQQQRFFNSSLFYQSVNKGSFISSTFASSLQLYNQNHIPYQQLNQPQFYQQQNQHPLIPKQLIITNNIITDDHILQSEQQQQIQSSPITQFKQTSQIPPPLSFEPKPEILIPIHEEQSDQKSSNQKQSNKQTSFHVLKQENRSFSNQIQSDKQTNNNKQSVSIPPDPIIPDIENKKNKIPNNLSLKEREMFYILFESMTQIKIEMSDYWSKQDIEREFWRKQYNTISWMHEGGSAQVLPLHFVVVDRKCGRIISPTLNRNVKLSKKYEDFFSCRIRSIEKQQKQQLLGDDEGNQQIEKNNININENENLDLNQIEFKNQQTNNKSKEQNKETIGIRNKIFSKSEEIYDQKSGLLFSPILRKRLLNNTVNSKSNKYKQQTQQQQFHQQQLLLLQQNQNNTQQLIDTNQRNLQPPQFMQTMITEEDGDPTFSYNYSHSYNQQYQQQQTKQQSNQTFTHSPLSNHYQQQQNNQQQTLNPSQQNYDNNTYNPALNKLIPSWASIDSNQTISYDDRQLLWECISLGKHALNKQDWLSILVDQRGTLCFTQYSMKVRVLRSNEQPAAKNTQSKVNQKKISIGGIIYNITNNNDTNNFNRTTQVITLTQPSSTYPQQQSQQQQQTTNISYEIELTTGTDEDMSTNDQQKKNEQLESRNWEVYSLYRPGVDGKVALAMNKEVTMRIIRATLLDTLQMEK